MPNNIVNTQQDINMINIDNYLNSEAVRRNFLSEMEYQQFVSQYKEDYYRRINYENNNSVSITQISNNINNTTNTTANNINNNQTENRSIFKYDSSILSDAPSGGGDSLYNYGLFNTPHMFTNLTDPHYSSTDWRGRGYSEHILSNSPVVVFRVGKPSYMSGDSYSQSVMQDVLDSDEETQKQYLNSLFTNSSQNEMYYYTFDGSDSVFKDYCDYVDSMVRYTAVKMNLGSKAFSASGESYGSFNLYNTHWKESSGNWFQTFFNSTLDLNNFIAFYCDGASTSSSESGSNTTGESQMASSIKSLGQTKREVDFLFGTSKNVSSDASSSFDSYKNSISQTYASIEGGVTGLLNKLGGMFTSISSGANVLFPEIWQDSSYRSNYSVEIKLTSPYGDDESIFRNIYIPFFCLLALALPRQSGKQGYVGPFLVQCYSKGWFSCNLGMIESIDVKKGGNGEWSINDLPTEITVSMNIKDLYPTMIASGLQSSTAFGNNTGLQEYLKVMAGVQLTDFDPVSNIEEAINVLLNAISPTNIATKQLSKINTTIGSGAKALIKSIFGGIN